MRKIVWIAILLVLFAVPVYASSFGDSLSGSGNWGLKVANALKGGKGLYGQATNRSGGGVGVYGVSTSQSGRGVYGLASRGGGKNIGVYGESKSNQGKGVMGFASKASGTTYGVYGRANSPDGWGLYTPNNAYVGDKLGIGTTSPKLPLHIEGSSQAYLLFDHSGPTYDWAVGSNSIDNENFQIVRRDHDGSGKVIRFRIKTNGDTQLVPASGNVGIGTVGPSAKLDVVGNTELNGDVDINSNLDVDSGTLFVNGTTNRIGIGTTTPTQTLEVSSVIRLTPAAGPENCDSTTEGSVYYDSFFDELCYCGGSGPILRFVKDGTPCSVQ
jgi:hypothetical protein